MDLFHPQPNGNSGFLLTALITTFTLNLLLGTFNLLPVPPLDGSTAIMLFMSESGAQKYLDWLRGNSFAIAGLLVGLVVFRQIFPYVQYFVMHLLF
jgi:Zn-dependent protease